MTSEKGGQAPSQTWAKKLLMLVRPGFLGEEPRDHARALPGDPDEWSPEEPHMMQILEDGDVWATGSTADRRWTFTETLA